MKITSVVPVMSPALAVDGSSAYAAFPTFSPKLHFHDVAMEADFQDFLRVRQNRPGFALVGSHFYLALSLTAVAAVSAFGYYYDGVRGETFDDMGKYQVSGAAILVAVIFGFEGVISRCSIRGTTLWSLLVALWVIASLWFTLLSTAVFSSLVGKSGESEVISGSVPIVLVNLCMISVFRCKAMMYTITGFTSLLLYISINFCVTSKDPVAVVFDFLLLAMSVIFAAIVILTSESLTRKAFSREAPEEKSLSGRFHPDLLTPKSEYGELLSAQSHSVLQDFQPARKVSMRAESRKDTDALNKTITMPQIELQIEKDEFDDNIDADAKEFVKQNYMTSKASEFEKSGDRAVPINAPVAEWMSEYHLNELQAVLNQLGKNWNFDMFFLQEVTNGKALSVSGRYCLLKYDLLSKLGIFDTEAESFFTAVERKYKPNPYHNSCHGADVLNSTLYLALHSQVAEYFSSLEVLAVTIAALCHDMGHGALTNRFLINTRDDLAIECRTQTDNDISVLEMMHASLTYTLLKEEDKNILKQLDNDAWMLVRKIVLKMILATGDSHADMSRHFELLREFKATHQSGQSPDMSKIDERLHIYEMCIKAGDVGHAAKELVLHEKWTLLVCEEFFRQGDIEQEQSLPVSMYCDRKTTSIPKVRRM